MSNDAKKLSELGVITASSLLSTDRLLVLHNVSTTPNTVTVTANNFIAKAGSFIPGPYDSDAAASSGGVQVKGLYYNSSGTVKIRLV